jgi:hypothetical protein
MFNGVKVQIGAETFTVPPLSLGQLRSGLLEKLKEHDALVAEGKIFEAMATRGEVILAALRRNYPDFPEEKLFEHLDMGNVSNLWLSVLGGSGFQAGEVQAATEQGTGT